MKTIKSISRFQGLTAAQLAASDALLLRLSPQGLRRQVWRSITTGKITRIDYFHFDFPDGWNPPEFPSYQLQISSTGLLELQGLLEFNQGEMK